MPVGCELVLNMSAATKHDEAEAACSGSRITEGEVAFVAAIQKRKAKVPQKQGIPSVGYKRPPEHSRFKPGQSGNPGGVKKGTVYISEAYKRMIALSPEDLKKYKPQSVAEEIAIRQARDARGDLEATPSLPAAKEIADRTEGRAPQTVTVTGDLTIENAESRKEWAEGFLESLMVGPPRLARPKAIALLRKQNAINILKFLGEAE